jgi:sugar phosphate isomerase/epimerase
MPDEVDPPPPCIADQLPPNMKPQRIAVSLNALNLPLRPALRRANEIDADGVQFELGRHFTREDMTESARRQLLHELDELGLGASSLTVPVNRPLSEWEGLEARIDGIKQAMLLAFQLKAGVVAFRTGRIPADASSPAYETLCGVLNDLARHANHVGAIPSLGWAGESAEAVSALLSQVKDGPLGVNFDPAAVVPSGQSPATVYRSLVESVNHITIRDAVRDIDDTIVEVPVGRGEVPWDEFLALTVEADYRGWMTAVRTQGDDKAGDVARAVKFVRNVLVLR